MDRAAFDRIYRQVPEERREWLWQFRAAHPHKRLVVDGTEWEYIACGQGREALLILGGAMSTAESSFTTIEQAEAEYRVLSLSYPPVGDMAALTDGLVAVLDQEGIARAHVFGHSLGAAIAHVLLRRHPDRVRKVALSGFGLYNERNARQAGRAVRLFGLLPYRLVKGYYTRRMATLLSELEEGERAFMLAYLSELLDSQHNKETPVGHFRLLDDFVRNASAYRADEAVDGTGRVLILQAKDDTGFQPDEQAALRATYPGAQVHFFESGGHLVGLTRRKEFDGVRYGFLKG